MKQKPENKNWLVNLVRRKNSTQSTNKQQGDTIAGQVEDSQNVVIGKNVIQIGRLTIPRYLAVLIVIGLMLGVTVGLFNALRNQQDAEKTDKLLEIANAPTPTGTSTPLPTLTPTATLVRMPEGNFNIAVAEFTLIDENISEDEHKAPGLAAYIPVQVALQNNKNHGSVQQQSLTSDEARGLAISAANFLATQIDLLGQINDLHQQEVVIWGPDEFIEFVEPGTEEARATQLKADILLYGTIRPVSKRHWELLPNFYVAEEKWGSDTAELLGSYALGTPLIFEKKQASMSKLNGQLEIRLRALAQMLIGLSRYDLGNEDGYRGAINAFALALADPEWGGSDQPQGQEIIYLFLGNAYIAQLSFVENSNDGNIDQNIIEMMQQLIDKARDAYEAGLMLNEQYAASDNKQSSEAMRWNHHQKLRFQNGLASLLERESRFPTLLDSEAVCNWNWDKLIEAEKLFQEVLDTPLENKVVPSAVDMVAHLGLGRSNRYWAICQGDKDKLTVAREHFLSVIDLYKTVSDTPSYLIDNVVLAYEGLGRSWLGVLQTLPPDETPNGIALATTYYAQAVDYSLNSKRHRLLEPAIKFMPPRLLLLCYNNQFNNQNDDLTSTLNEFVGYFVESESVRDKILDSVEFPQGCSYIK